MSRAILFLVHSVRDVDNGLTEYVVADERGEDLPVTYQFTELMLFIGGSAHNASPAEGVAQHRADQAPAQRKNTEK